MKKNILQRLSENYFQGIADDISNAKVISSIYSNTSDSGDIRENILLRFLQTHLPARCSVMKGGTIFDSLANESKQIDLLITNDFSLKFSYFDKDSQNSKNIQSIEGCLAAISVKSTLDKCQLEDALENLASIPKMPDNMLDNISFFITNREDYLLLPKKVIFAFEGSSVDNIQEHINTFYKNNELENYQKPDLIIVNNQFCFVKTHKNGGKTRDGSIIPPSVYYPEYNRDLTQKNKRFGALPLLRLLAETQTAANWSPHVLFDYSGYIDKMSF